MSCLQVLEIKYEILQMPNDTVSITRTQLQNFLFKVQKNVDHLYYNSNAQKLPTEL